jgi:hypothetical protein
MDGRYQAWSFSSAIEYGLKLASGYILEVIPRLKVGSWSGIHGVELMSMVSKAY